ncbi:hypothetical protein EK21DRAFT_103376 [Setomelanomma holmii]|uniref:HTH CENPB-type domain-containing protein n=1 Tax=Setomelanomma holmii TaxID=210430 RepID=A0A9P4H443_9PLEO|nr:hypothetical protein EK21DRAFT_103376 [Setomelanomma holmii]
MCKKFGVDRTTLSQRCQGFQQSMTAANLNKQKLHLQEEDELVRYINDLTKRGLSPTREMTRKFGEEIAHKHIGDGWVTCFAKYSLYFDLLYGKITQYDVEPAHTYNMDEKGFAIGVIGKQKRIFSKRMWQSREVSQVLQDGSREWITVLAGVCADGSTLPPGLIYASKKCSIRSN